MAIPTPRARRGRHAQLSGLIAEALVSQVLLSDDWVIFGRRLRTEAGEIDIVAERDGVLAFIEVKQRKTLADAAVCLSYRQRKRLIGAAEILLAEHPEWGRAGVRFDVMMVDAAGVVRRVVDAFRLD